MTDPIGLSGKPVLVVGGAGGIGRATSQLLAALGARVAIADIDGAAADEVAREIGGYSIVGDVTDDGAAAAMVDHAQGKLGGLAGVANIVGRASWSDLLSVDLATWEADFRMNLLHHLMVSRAAAKHMMRQGGGAIAIVTSVSGIYGSPRARSLRRRQSRCGRPSPQHGR